MLRLQTTIVLIATFLAPTILVSQPKRLGGGSDPAFSPDAKRIAYKHGNSLATMGLDGKSIRFISRLAWDDSPSWSPDGKRIVFQSYGQRGTGKGEFAIWIIDSNGTNPHKLIEASPRRGQYPRWSPNGKLIAWTHGQNIWIADSSGHNAHPLTPPPTKSGDYEYLGDWSPDSRSIVYFKSVDYSSYRVWIIDVDGSNRRELHAYSDARAAKWSRKSGLIFYTDEKMLYKVKPDGSDNISVCSFGAPYQVMQFDISFDERTVVFSVGGAEVDEEIFLLNLPRGRQ